MPHSAPLPGSLETTGWIQNCAVRSEMFLAETTRGSWERGLCLRRRRRNRFVIKSKQGYLFVKLEKYGYLFTLNDSNILLISFSSFTFLWILSMQHYHYHPWNETEQRDHATAEAPLRSNSWWECSGSGCLLWLGQRKSRHVKIERAMLLCHGHKAQNKD